MKKTYLEDLFERMNDKVFFVLVISVQVIFIFQGLDFTDSGFDAEFYSRIFSDPSSVQYNFMFWFTGIIGGTWLKLFPDMGLMGLRFAGVLITTITFWITYDLLKRYLHTGPLRLSLLLIILFLSTAIKELNYDDVSALFFMCAAALLFSGLTKNNSFYLFLAGSFISFNSFSRVSNISGLLLVSAIWYFGYLNRSSTWRIFSRSFTYFLGFLIGCLGMILLMRYLHHDMIFINSLKFVSQMGANSKNSHGIYSLIKASLVNYGEALTISIVTLVALWSSSAAWKIFKTGIPNARPYLKLIKYFLLAVLTALIIYRAKRDPDFWLYLFMFYAGTSLIVGFLIVTGRQPANLRLLTAIGCIMLLVLPVGSDYVLLTVGKYSVWIIVPITIDYLLNIQSLSSRVVLSENRQHIYEQVIDREQITGLRQAVVYLTLIFVLAVSYYYPYFDRSDRFEMRFEVNNPHVRGIYTTGKRARVIDELLAASAKFVKPGDYVLAFESLPMYHFLTDTRPFMHNSWLRQYDDEVFHDELNKALKETQVVPVIIMQKRSTLGNNWPENYKEDFKFKAGQWDVMQKFIKSYQYHVAWENDFFEIYLTENKNTSIHVD